MARQVIKDFYGRIIGYTDSQPNGDIIAKDEYGKILGKFDKKMNVTKDAYGKILTSGDTTSSLIWQAYQMRQLQLNQNKK